jgi:hypothetical protein
VRVFMIVNVFWMKRPLSVSPVLRFVHAVSGSEACA